MKLYRKIIPSAMPLVSSFALGYEKRSSPDPRASLGEGQGSGVVRGLVLDLFLTTPVFPADLKTEVECTFRLQVPDLYPNLIFLLPYLGVSGTWKTSSCNQKKQKQLSKKLRLRQFF